MIKLSKTTGEALDGSSPTQVNLALAKQNVRTILGATAAFTDNGAGTDNKTIYLVDTAALVNSANVSTNLADKTTAEAAAVTVKDALMELVAKTNVQLALVGEAVITNNIGGTAADGTIAAVTKTVSAAATGIQASNTITYAAAVNAALVAICAKVNQLRRAAGYPEVGETIRSAIKTAPALLTTLPALVVNSLGTAASPGVTKVLADAMFLDQANSIKALSAALDGVRAASTPLVLVG